jgi:hypothetical protein
MEERCGPEILYRFQLSRKALPYLKTATRGRFILANCLLAIANWYYLSKIMEQAFVRHVTALPGMEHLCSNSLRLWVILKTEDGVGATIFWIEEKPEWP